ncbi:hypothetical protein ACFQH6_19945 [Halobacteriaceae archaeon GCM10025711]
MSDDVNEDRIYTDTRDRNVVYLATATGVAFVKVAGSFVGRFGVAHRCDARDVAATDDRLAVATSDGVLAYAGDEFVPVGFDDATTVGFDGDDVVAAAADGRVARMTAPDEWTDLGTLDADVRAIDGDLVATDAGVYRAGDDALQHVGLDDVRDVAAPGVPHAATADGLYRLGNGWMDVLDGDFHAVAIDPTTAEPGSPALAHAATRESLFEYLNGEWTPVDLPVAEPVLDVAYGEGLYVVTEDATFMANSGGTCAPEDDGWRIQQLGFRDVRGVALL